MPPGPTIVSYPDYTSGNAYQPLLYATYQGPVFYGNVEDAINLCGHQDKVILHINWINQVVVSNSADTRKNMSYFKEKIGSFVARGGIVAWTVHNLYGHATPNELLDDERALRQWLVETVDVLILHKYSHLSIIASEYGAIPKRVYFHDHGLYKIDELEFPKSSEFADLVNELQPIIGLIGQIRPYKGLNDAVAILNRLTPNVTKNMHVLIAGRIEWSFKEEAELIVGALREKVRVTLIDKRLDDSELYSATQMSRAVLLPYHNILNSGSLRYNQSVGALSLMPSRHEALFADEPGIIFYHQHAHAAQLLEEIINQPREQADALKKSIISQSKKLLNWPDLTSLFTSLA